MVSPVTGVDLGQCVLHGGEGVPYDHTQQHIRLDKTPGSGKNY